MNDTLIPPLRERPQLVETAAEGRPGGPSYTYRGATIDRQKGGYVCRLWMKGHPPDGQSFGVAGTITPLVDIWVDEERLPRCMRAVPKTER
ncbi:hypothetical protein JMJ56_32275 [Belnapia sp. T18]|uniref:Uncharacterized protein n=1 Tax=Belnapia arida TaxID=2804533 RepID=A0ABS1UD99_9PROT|nr:hypothetical protein [Belnapia arida]MBL6082643.1 hypothetical protein [Belnapia arida]